MKHKLNSFAGLCILLGLLIATIPGPSCCQQHGPDGGDNLQPEQVDAMQQHQQHQQQQQQPNQEQISHILTSQSQLGASTTHQDANGIGTDSLVSLSTPLAHLSEQAQQAAQSPRALAPQQIQPAQQQPPLPLPLPPPPSPQPQPHPVSQTQVPAQQQLQQLMQELQQQQQVQQVQQVQQLQQQQAQQQAQQHQQQQQQQLQQQVQQQQQRQQLRTQPAQQMQQQPAPIQYQVVQPTPQQQPQQQQQPQIQQIPQIPVQEPPTTQQATLQARQQVALTNYAPTGYHLHPSSPLYFGHNPFIEILKPQSYADDNIVTLNLSHSHIYEIDSDAFVGQRFEHIDLSNNKLGLIHSRSFRIGPNHSRHNPYNPHSNSSKQAAGSYPTRRPPPAHPKSVTIDFSHNPAIVALSGAFDHIDVPNCLLNFTNSTVELKFGAFKKYFKEHPGHIIDIETVDCCEQEWLLGYKHNFVLRTRCEHDPNLFLSKVSQQAIIDSCISYVTSARYKTNYQEPGPIQQGAKNPRNHSPHTDNQYLTYLILGGTAMILTSLSIYIIFYMFSLKAAFVYQMQNKS